MLSLTVFLSYLPEAGEYASFFVYLRLVSLHWFISLLRKLHCIVTRCKLVSKLLSLTTMFVLFALSLWVSVYIAVLSHSIFHPSCPLLFYPRHFSLSSPPSHSSYFLIASYHFSLTCPFPFPYTCHLFPRITPLSSLLSPEEFTTMSHNLQWLLHGLCGQI